MRETIQKKITNTIVDNAFTGIVDVAPRVGKTKAVLSALNTLKNKKIVVIAPYADIINSWQEEITKWKYKKPIEFHTTRSINKIKKADLIVIDEIHELSTAQIKSLKKLNIKLLGLTGTLSEEVELTLNTELGLVPIISYGIEQAIIDGIINDYEIVVHGIDLDNSRKNIVAGNKYKKFNQSELDNYTYLDKHYKQMFIMKNKLSKDIVTLKKVGKSTEEVEKELITVNIRLQIAITSRTNALYNYPLKVFYVKSILNANLAQKKQTLIFTTRIKIADDIGNPYHTETQSDLQAFKEGKLNYISAVGMLSLGVSFPNCNNIVIHQLQSNQSTAIQKVMRACIKNDTGVKTRIDIVYYKNTQDKIWLDKYLKGFDKTKITYV